MSWKLTMIAICVLGWWLAAVNDQRAQGGVWLDVPFVKQERNLCGAACISMVLQYWSGFAKHQVSTPLPSSNEIGQTLYSKEAAAIQGKDIERYFGEQGYQAFVFKGEWADLEQHLSKGRPLIACVEAGGKGAPLHYVVIVGIDPQQALVLVNDPAQRKLLKLSRSNFEKSWEPTTRWTLLALPRLTSSQSLD
jgi:ABC-type bacteriocin/lantibiotic exporter with double-glycine peptidase domain